MKRTTLILIGLLWSTVAQAGLDGYVFLYPIETSFRSSGQAAWYGALRERDTEAELTGDHSVHGPVVFNSPIAVTGMYSYDLEGPAEAGACYGTTLEVTANRGIAGSTSATFTGDTRCAPPPPVKKKDDPEQTPECEQSPIVVALDGRYEFTDTDGGVQFDIDADGDADRVAWPRDGSVAFLFSDRNGNGLPDDGGELFGDHTRLRDGAQARHGFEALAEFDTDGDGAVTALDAQWTQLGFWQDRDHDGRATHDEISTLDANGISALGLTHHWTGRRDAHGNILRWQSSIVRAGTGPRPYYDVFLLTRAAS